MGSEGRFTGIAVKTILGGLGRSLNEVTAVGLRRFFIDGHGVFKVIFEIGLVRFLK